MGLIDDLLKQQTDRIALLERRVATLEQRVAAGPKPAALRNFRSEVLLAIQRHWDRTKEPLQQRFLSQTFARPAKNTSGGLNGILADLEREGTIRSLKLSSGANLFFPADGFASLSPEAIEAMTLAGLSDIQKKRLRARQTAYVESAAIDADGPSEAELAAADAEALEAFRRGGGK